MNETPDTVQSGYLYARNRKDAIGPYLAVESTIGMHLIYVPLLHEADRDGPHELTAEMLVQADEITLMRDGEELRPWSVAREAIRAFEIIAEAEEIIARASRSRIDDDLTQALAELGHSGQVELFYGNNGIKEAVITIKIKNPYQLRSTLRYLGVDAETLDRVIPI